VPRQNHNSTRRKASLFVTALAATALVAFSPVGAAADTPGANGAGDRAAAREMAKRLGLEVRKPMRGTAKRPPRRPPQKTHRAVARAAVYYSDGECDIRPAYQYFANSTLSRPYWVQFQASNGVWVGYSLFYRYGERYEYPAGISAGGIRTCSLYLGTQQEWYYWSGSQWVWAQTWNCDVVGNCRRVR
jgi:hypothetical protein